MVRHTSVKASWYTHPMLDLYALPLSFLPILLYAGIGSLLFYAGSFTFNKGGALLGTSFVLHMALNIVAGNWLGIMAQTILSVGVFALLIMFFSGRTSGETILTMTALLALTPIPSGLLAIVGSLVVFLVYAVIKLRKSEVYTTLYTAITASGMTQGLPNYDHLGDRKDLEADAQRVSLMPFMALVYGAFSIFFLVQTIMMDV